MKNNLLTTQNIALAALIAAFYAAASFILAPVSFGPVQFRVAEALTVLPWSVPAAVPGLFIGCLISNMIGGYGLIDIVLGSAATLLAAWLTSKAPTLWLAALPPVLVNALVVGCYLGLITDTPMIWSICAWVCPYSPESAIPMVDGADTISAVFSIWAVRFAGPLDGAYAQISAIGSIATMPRNTQARTNPRSDQYMPSSSPRTTGQRIVTRPSMNGGDITASGGNKSAEPLEKETYLWSITR